MSELAILAGVAAAAVVIAVGAVKRVWLIVVVAGDGMAPTLRAGERVLARRIRGGREGLRRADIVVFRMPTALSMWMEAEGLPLRVKRIAAVEGDLLPGWFRGSPWAQRTVKVPEGKLVVAGDNPNAKGQRQVGYIDVQDVVAVVRR